MQLQADIPPDPVAVALRAGRAQEALRLLQDQIRADGASARLRLSLVQLLCVLGQWDRARTQLQVLDSLGEEFKSVVTMVAPALIGESLRREVFAGRTTPLVLGEPLPWVASLVQALRTADAEAASRLRAGAFEAAAAIPARVDGVEVPWLADADSRLGPVLEGIIDGKYYWIPFERIRRLSLPLPTDVRHLVWLPVQATWTTGAEQTILVPSRYEGSEAQEDERLKLGRLTTWVDIGGGQYRGYGQRQLTGGESDFPWLQTRLVEFRPAA